MLAQYSNKKGWKEGKQYISIHQVLVLIFVYDMLQKKNLYMTYYILIYIKKHHQIYTYFSAVEKADREARRR